MNFRQIYRYLVRCAPVGLKSLWRNSQKVDETELSRGINLQYGSRGLQRGENDDRQATTEQLKFHRSVKKGRKARASDDAPTDLDRTTPTAQKLRSESAGVVAAAFIPLLPFSGGSKTPPLSSPQGQYISAHDQDWGVVAKVTWLKMTTSLLVSV